MKLRVAFNDSFAGLIYSAGKIIDRISQIVTDRISQIRFMLVLIT